jgi:hypothetical protein
MSVKLPLRPVGRVLLRVPGSRSQWIGPIDPPANAANADPSQLLVLSHDGFAKVHDIPEDAFQEIVIEGRMHRVLRPTFELPAHSGYFSLQGDAELLRALLKRAKKWNPDLGSLVETSQQLIRAFETGLASERLSEDDRAREWARLRAAQSLLDDVAGRLQLDSELMQLVVLELRSLPAVRAQLNAEQQQELDRKREELRNELRPELEAAQKELAEARAATQRAREELTTLVGEVETTVQSIVAKSVPMLTEHALFRALYSAQPRPRPPVAEISSDVRALTSPTDITRATMSAAVASHVDPFVLRLLTSLLVGSGLVLLGGTSADRAALAAARLLASGGAVRVSVTPAIFGSAELLNAPCSPVGEGDAPAATLGEFLRRAACEDRVSLVILQGCNRAPPENSLLELMEFTMPPRGVHRLAWTNRRGDVEETPIDGRVLFVGTLVNAETTFRIPVSLAHRIPALWADRSETPRAVLENASPWTATRATAEAWRIVGERLPAIDGSAIRSFREMFPDTEPEAIVAAYAQRVGAAFGSDASTGFGEALAALVAGRAPQDRLEQVARQLPAQVRDAFDVAIKSSTDSLSRYYAEEQHG